jgi:hypothetical protein
METMTSETPGFQRFVKLTAFLSFFPENHGYARDGSAATTVCVLCHSTTFQDVDLS